MPENSPTNREFGGAHFINEMVDAGEITAHEASTMDINKFIADYFKRHTEQEKPLTVTGREFISQEKDGYLSDEAVIRLTSKDAVTQAKLKMAPHPIALETDNPSVRASYKGGIWFEEPKTLEQLKADCATELKTLISIGVAEELTEEQKQQLIVQVAQTYKESYESYFAELREAVRPIQELFLEILGKIPRDNPEKFIEQQSARVFRDFGSEGIFAINLLRKAYQGKFLQARYESGDPRVVYAPFYSLISVLGAKDIQKLRGIYYTTLADEKFISEKEAKSKNPVPTDKLMEGIAIAEIGGDFPSYFEHMGAKCFYNREKGFHHEQVSLHPEDQVTLENYQSHFPEPCDFTFTREVLDMGSGIERGFGSTRLASIDLLAACANMTKKGGYTIHEGNNVPKDPQILERLGLKLVGVLPTQEGANMIVDPVYVFEKVSDKKVLPQDL